VAGFFVLLDAALRCVSSAKCYSICGQFLFPLSAFYSQARDRQADKVDMERETILSVIWNTDGSPEQVAEMVRARLESGDLVAAGNFRNEPASYWQKDDDK
jgi:hypothetical protein